MFILRKKENYRRPFVVFLAVNIGDIKGPLHKVKSYLFIVCVVVNGVITAGLDGQEFQPS